MTKTKYLKRIKNKFFLAVALLVINLIFLYFTPLSIPSKQILITHAFLTTLFYFSELVIIKTVEKKRIPPTGFQPKESFLAIVISINFGRILACLFFLFWKIVFPTESEEELIDPEPTRHQFITNFLFVYFIYLFLEIKTLRKNPAT